MTDVGKDCLYPERLPFRYRSMENGLSRWWDERAVPVSRHGMTAFFGTQGYTGPQDYLVKNLGLSLTYQYWIYLIDSPLSWSKINLYENDFRSDQLTLSSDHPSDQVPAYTANSTLQGDLEKTWIIMNGIRTLIKGKEFVSAYDLISSEPKTNDISYFEHFVRLAVTNELDEEQLHHDLDMQILCDFVLSGYDRHLNNLGVIRNPKTLRFERLAPIFDSGGALFAGKELPTTRRDLLHVKTNSFASREVPLLSYVRDLQVLDIRRLPSLEWVRSLYEKDPLQSEQRILSVMFAYEQKIEILSQLQHGHDPFRMLFGA